ncbi:hypothetical protein CYMTET_45664 [Cymbomonas tetramitiformis]|uniref:Uncharacterized protein n=1 Tax=Cymbomonas tetramitiformis TaxID=36881 RepID=A0AAE0BXT4_9CHLO|nr:hypothetical protein CYMTET_45664 [Cymbomonas tetramitiformis]
MLVLGTVECGPAGCSVVHLIIYLTSITPLRFSTGFRSRRGKASTRMTTLSPEWTGKAACSQGDLAS